jgi:D-lactate dehydrogenase
MKIHCAEVTTEELNYLQANLSDLEFSSSPDKLDGETALDETIEMLSIFVGSEISEGTLRRYPNLKFIATRSTGYDHIDLNVCKKAKVKVSNVPSYGEHTVAEFAFGLILALSRKIYLGVDRLKKTGEFSYDDMQGFDLKNKTLGIIGTGKIGRHVITMAKGFDMSILAYDPYPDKLLAEQYGFRYVTLEELLPASDVVTIHVPYLSTTHHLIDETRLALMKPTALLINVSRGGLVDTEALLVALEEKKLGGAGLDVLEEEGHIKDEYSFLKYGHPQATDMKVLLANHRLLKLPNVLVTPHMAFYTGEGVERILKTTVDNIQAFLSKKPQNLVS